MKTKTTVEAVDFTEEDILEETKFKTLEMPNGISVKNFTKIVNAIQAIYFNEKLDKSNWEIILAAHAFVKQEGRVFEMVESLKTALAEVKAKAEPAKE